ncbi:DUF6907 domain-containing protein [Nocardia nova]|uniref:DUF6907 domain-containing protein n=1 Tax=Nocardia nova TaxID=37330 RepID=UPI0027395009|nr:hypothetical protein [Nocardia nova]
MTQSSTRPCPAFCVKHENINDGDGEPAAWSHEGRESELTFRYHDPARVWLSRHDAPDREPEYSVFLYPKGGLMQLSLEEARTLNAELSARIAQADVDRHR